MLRAERLLLRAEARPKVGPAESRRRLLRIELRLLADANGAARPLEYKHCNGKGPAGRPAGLLSFLLVTTVSAAGVFRPILHKNRGVGVPATLDLFYSVHPLDISCARRVT